MENTINKIENFNRLFKADKAEFQNVLNFVEEILTNHNVDIKIVYQINIAIEEIFVNVASYAYQGSTGDCEININIDENNFVCEFIDQGIEFNPLEKKDPDTTLSAEERDIGGLGIFMVKNIMDEVTYSRVDNKNILKIVKKIK